MQWFVNYYILCDKVSVTVHGNVIVNSFLCSDMFNYSRTIIENGSGTVFF